MVVVGFVFCFFKKGGESARERERWRERGTPTYESEKSTQDRNRAVTSLWPRLGWLTNQESPSERAATLHTRDKRRRAGQILLGQPRSLCCATYISFDTRHRISWCGWILYMPLTLLGNLAPSKKVPFPQPEWESSVRWPPAFEFSPWLLLIQFATFHFMILLRGLVCFRSGTHLNEAMGLPLSWRQMS